MDFMMGRALNDLTTNYLSDHPKYKPTIEGEKGMLLSYGCLASDPRWPEFEDELIKRPLERCELPA